MKYAREKELINQIIYRGKARGSERKEHSDEKKLPGFNACDSWWQSRFKQRLRSRDYGPSTDIYQSIMADNAGKHENMPK